MKAFTTGPFTGRHAAAILVAFFGVVIAVNFAMARLASSTFGGVVVENSYVASQNFNGWLDEARREKALGWSAEAARLSDGRLILRLTGAPDSGVAVTALARHPLDRAPDQALRLTRQTDGRFVSDQALPAGRWRLRIEALAGQQHWRTELDVR
jgi:nitrogen fixation protein FixH